MCKRRFAPDTAGVILERSEGSGRYQRQIKSEILRFAQNDGGGGGMTVGVASEILRFAQNDSCGE